MRTVLFLLFASLAFAQNTTVESVTNYKNWGWQAIVMQNDIITVTTTPEIGARIMEYNLGEHPSIYVNPDMFGHIETPTQGVWYNYGGYKVWPAPQAVWNWPPPAILDNGSWSSEIISNTADSVAVYVKSQKETWNKTPNLSMERRTVIYKNSSRVKIEQTIINENNKTVNWSVWDVTQSIVHHDGERDYENFWVYFPIKTKGSLFGSDGVRWDNDSEAWTGEVAPGVFGVQFKPEGKKIFADSPKGWICYADERDGMIFAKVFSVWEDGDYPDEGARNEAWINNNPAYVEVEVVSPIWEIAPSGGKITFTENWYAAHVFGPIIDVNHFGAVAKALVYNKATSTLEGKFGVFYNGQAMVQFKDASGAVLAEGATLAVNPQTELNLQENLSIPNGTAVAELLLMDADGNALGVINSVAIANLVGVSENPQPTDFALLPNYPNPFNPSTQISYSLAEKSYTTLDIFNVHGQRVRQLLAADLPSGTHSTIWDATDDEGELVSSGLYFYRLTANAQAKVGKMLFTK